VVNRLGARAPRPAGECPGQEALALAPRVTAILVRLGGPAELEGGDILVIGNRCVLIGMGGRAAVHRTGRMKR
jgi:arginine deiminase